MNDKSVEPEAETERSASVASEDNNQSEAATAVAAEASDVDASKDDAEPKLTPRQARLKAREERRRRLAAQRAEKADQQGAVVEKAVDGEDATEDGGPKARKRRDVLTAARRQTEYIQKQEARVTAPTDEDAALAEQLGQTALVPHDPKDKVLVPPQEKTFTEAEREAEVAEIQRDLVRRRRRRWAMLWLRIAFFIVLPTFLVGNYFYNYATPFYATKTAFVIERGSSPSAIATGSLFSGTSLVTARESISVQEFLLSREAMRVLDDELGILAHFRDPQLDPIQPQFFRGLVDRRFDGQDGFWPSGAAIGADGRVIGKDAGDLDADFWCPVNAGQATHIAEGREGAKDRQIGAHGGDILHANGLKFPVLA